MSIERATVEQIIAMQENIARLTQQRDKLTADIQALQTRLEDQRTRFTLALLDLGLIDTSQMPTRG